jgi:hypothetical protein
LRGSSSSLAAERFLARSLGYGSEIALCQEPRSTREAVTEVVVFILFELGEAYAARAAAFIRDPPKV